MSHPHPLRFRLLLAAAALAAIALSATLPLGVTPGPAFAAPAAPLLAPTPPLGWNSYDSYGGIVDEQEFRANAAFVAQHLKALGYRYVVVDYYWYFPQLPPKTRLENLPVAMDAYGRLLPAENRFPSAAGGKGFKPLADYVHSLGLKFGIHIMRGIPRQAVKRNLPVMGTNAHARDVVDPANPCGWSDAMFGVDASKPAGQAYYDSIARLYASWGVDYIKADDMSAAGPPARDRFHGAEIEALRKAMNKTGRPMVLSLSPGPTPLDHAADVMRWSQLWRISNDMWDNWKELQKQFDYTRAWAPYIGPNHWPDADMLPLGRLRVRGFDEPARMSRFTHDEEVTLMSLWAIFRSPLMMGGDLPTPDAFTLGLISNPEMLAVDQHSSHNHELYHRGNLIAWTASAPGGRARYVALFNLGESAAPVAVTWKELGLPAQCHVRDLWQRKDLGAKSNQLAPQINPHGAGLYKVW
jgi:alpha-galactosidase